MFENVSLFEHFHSMFKKSAIINQHFFSITKINMGYQKTQNFMLISNLLKWVQKNVQKKSYRQKTLPKSAKSEKLEICLVFCL